MIPLTFSDVDDAKAEGNAEFQKVSESRCDNILFGFHHSFSYPSLNRLTKKGNLEKSIGKYQDAIQIISKIQVSTNDQNKAEATLVANIAMCRLKQCELKTNASTLQPLFNVIEDITSAISILDKVTASDTKALRSKLLYRRSKARHTLAMKHTMLEAPSIGNMELIQLCTSAQADLQSLLSFDSSNKAATVLMQRMKADTVKMMKESGISTSSSSPMCSALNNLLDITNGNLSNKVLDFEKILQSLKFIHASILDDVTNASHELLKDEMRGGKMLVNIGFGEACIGKDGGDELQVLATQCLSSACAYPIFTALLITILDTMFGGDLESKIFDIVSSETYSPNFINGALSLQMRLIVHKHVKEDDENYNWDSRELEKERDIHVNEDQTRICSAALESKHEECRSMGLNLLTAWLEENPLHVIKASAGDDNRIAYSKVKEPLEDQVRQMVPRDLAEYRKSSAQRNSCRKERSRKNAIIFCNSGGLNTLLSSAANSDQGFWRRECILNTGRLMNHVRDDTAPRGDDNLSVDELTKNILTKLFAENEHRLTIEEVDGGELDAERAGEDVEIVRCMKRCLFATSLLLANGEMGAWALKEIWNNARSEWEHLALSNNYSAMSAASEFASAAAGEKETRPWISSCVDATSADGLWRKLLACDDREVRSGAASAVAKLGLADKSVSSDGGELIALLDVAAGLLEEDESAFPSVKDSSTGAYRAPMERGVELLSYLSSKTLVKDEIAHGFSVSTSAAGEPSSILEKLVKLSDPKSEISPAIKFALASIFACLAVTIETLRREAFEGKEITLEQYDDLQAMGKPDEERKMEESKKDSDTADALASRIKVMAKHHIPQALVNLSHNATEGTSKQAVTALSRMACEQAVRGSMIQQGCLSVCIQMSKTVSTRYLFIVFRLKHRLYQLILTSSKMK